MAFQYQYTVMRDRVKPLLVAPCLRSCFYPHTPWTHTEAQSVKVRRGSNKVTGSGAVKQENVRKWDGLVVFVVQHGLIWAVSRAVPADRFQPKGNYTSVIHTPLLCFFMRSYSPNTHTHTPIWPGNMEGIMKIKKPEMREAKVFMWSVCSTSAQITASHDFVPQNKTLTRRAGKIVAHVQYFIHWMAVKA